MKKTESIVIGRGNLTDEHEARHDTEIHKTGLAHMTTLIGGLLALGEAMQEACGANPEACCPVCAVLQAQGDLAYGLLNRLPEEARAEVRDGIKAMIDDVYMFVEKEDTAGSA